MSKVKRFANKLIRSIYLIFKKSFPPSLRVKLDRVKQYYFDTIYWDWYRTKFMGSMNFIKYIFNVSPSKKKEKILGIWNFQATNFGIGGLIEFNLQLLCEAHRRVINEIDIALLYNPLTPVKKSKYSSWITKDNIHYHLMEQFPLLNVNPKLSSIFIFNSKEEFDSFLNKNIDKYYLVPSLFTYVNELSGRLGIYRFFKDFYLKYGFLPKLKIPESTDLWSKALINKYANGRFVVAVSLRSNPFHSLSRNADINVWKSLFEYCLRKKYNIVFLILGRKSEMTDELRLPNVLLSKDYNTDVQQNLALIQNSLFYMATSSGLISFAFLSNDIPYIITNFLRDFKDGFVNYKWLNPKTNILWQNKEFQKLSFEKETPEFLIKEFENLFSKVDKIKWLKSLTLNTDVDSLLNWPYLVKK